MVWMIVTGYLQARGNLSLVRQRVHLEFVMLVGRLPSGGDVKALAEGSGPTSMTTSSRGTLRQGPGSGLTAESIEHGGRDPKAEEG